MFLPTGLEFWILIFHSVFRMSTVDIETCRNRITATFFGPKTDARTSVRCTHETTVGVITAKQMLSTRLQIRVTAQERIHYAALVCPGDGRPPRSRPAAFPKRALSSDGQ